LEAKYLAHGIVPQIYILSPQRVILGGGVMEQTHLFPKVRRHVGEILNGYIQARVLLEDLDAYIVPPGLGNRAGVLGAVALAQRAAGTD
jgi:fructokinase